MTNLLSDLGQTLCQQKQRPLLIAISGGVASGKTTLAEQLVHLLQANGLSAQACSTDNFLQTNASLAKQKLAKIKGWPQTYDIKDFIKFISSFKSGLKQEYSIPYYCQNYYDLLPNNYLHIAPSDVLIVEGVIALQPQIAEIIDVGLYLEVAPIHAKTWFMQRCFANIKNAVGKKDNFYHKWSAWEQEKVQPILEECWQEINLRNLHENIMPTREFADYIITKDAQHNIVAITENNHA